MQRRQVLFGVLGLALAASAAHAAVPNQVTLFGQKYSVTVSKRAVTYKNGVTITVNGSADPTAGNGRAALDFVPGADPSADRLFAGCDIAGGAVADQLYVLTGADPKTGVFDETNSTATQFFGGKVNDDVGGRVTNVLFLHDPNSAVAAGKDRDLALVQFSGPDELQFYDLRNLTGGNFVSDSVFGRYIAGDASSTDFRNGQDTNPTQHMDIDDNMPHAGFVSLAHGPNGTIVATGQTSDSSALEMGVMDPTKDTFYPVLTNLATANSKLDGITFGPALLQMSDTEYWLLTQDADPGGQGNDVTTQDLYRLKVTFPTDLAKGKADSIKIDVMATEDLVKLGLAASAKGIYGLTVGRAAAANGPRRLYMADYEGNIFTLNPM
jgi:hypothetical protein